MNIIHIISKKCLVQFGQILFAVKFNEIRKTAKIPLYFTLISGILIREYVHIVDI